MAIKTLLTRPLKKGIKRVLISLGLSADQESALPNSLESYWATILSRDAVRWKSACAAAKTGPSVLIASNTSMNSIATVFNSMLAVALTLRGAQVHVLRCDEALPACGASVIDGIQPEEMANFGPSRRLCGTCFAPSYKLFRSFGLPVHRYSDFISHEEMQRARNLSSALPVDEIPQYRLDGVGVGEQAAAGAVRYYLRGNLKGETHGEAVLRRYFNASLLTAFATHRLLQDFSFSCMCAIDGMYVPTGTISEVARQRQVRVVNWSPAYRKHTFVFSHHNTYHQTMLSEPTACWENMTWTPEMEAEIMDYLNSRWYGTRDWIGYNQNPQDDISHIAAELGVDFSKPCVGLLTNIMWEAQLFYNANAFQSMLEWTLQSIRYFADRPDLQLIVRVHPAEVHGSQRSRQLMVDEIARAFPVLPKNVFIIPPESPISTYVTMSKCDAVIIYGTQAGVEMTSMGIPVIVAGESWVRNKGVSMDANSPEEYFGFLDRLPLKERLSEAVIQRARKYAYHFFFRRMIPLPFMEPTGTWPPYEIKVSTIDDLSPGRTAGLDVICDGILNGGEFLYPAELNLGKLF